MKKIIPIFIPQQGCRQRCIFCHQPYITGVALHAPVTPADVRQALDTALAEPKSRKKGAQFEAAFYGGTFTGLALNVQEQLLQTVQPYLKRGEIVGIRLSTHPNMFNERILALLAAYRVTTVELGVQSFDPLVLQNAARGHTGAEAEEIVRKLQNEGMAVVVHLMLGLPGASAESDLQSAAKTIALRPAAVRLHPTLVLRQTRLADLYQQQQYAPLSLAAAVSLCQEMVKRLRAQQIPIIRIGLQPTVSLAQNLIAGPYHPAIRQLVESALAYEEMAALCANQPFPEKEVTFYVAPQDLSTMRGQKNANLTNLQRQFGFRRVAVAPDVTLPRGELRLA